MTNTRKESDTDPYLKLQELSPKTYISQARTVCQQINTDTKSWPGITYDESREAEIQIDLRRLVGFRTTMRKIDQMRWDSFEQTLNLGITTQYNIYLINITEIEREGWNVAAAAELGPYYDFISNKFTNETVEEILRAINNGSIEALVVDYFESHVGKDKIRIEIVELTPRDGLDGTHTTCPIVKAPNIGIFYFTVATAEFFLMRAIAKTYNKLKS